LTAGRSGGERYILVTSESITDLTTPIQVVKLGTALATFKKRVIIVVNVTGRILTKYTQLDRVAHNGLNGSIITKYFFFRVFDNSLRDVDTGTILCLRRGKTTKDEKSNYLKGLILGNVKSILTYVTNGNEFIIDALLKHSKVLSSAFVQLIVDDSLSTKSMEPPLRQWMRTIGTE
jgi:hypothetical protein